MYAYKDYFGTTTPESSRNKYNIGKSHGDLKKSSHRKSPFRHEENTAEQNALPVLKTLPQNGLKQETVCPPYPCF